MTKIDIMMKTKDIKFRLLDFNIYSEEIEYSSDSSSECENNKKKFGDNKEFIIQMFGLDEKGKTYSIHLDDYQPFFYLKVSDNWNKSKKEALIKYIINELGSYYENSIVDYKIIQRKELYGFNSGKKYNFIMIKFKNIQVMNKVKNLFYENKNNERQLKKNGLIFNDTNIYLYEANIPPLLRFFHIKNISPSGWIMIPKSKINKHNIKITNCDFEYTTSYKAVIPLNDRETNVPYKICSFDIEASSSHGDFPLAIKTYKKLVTNILDYWLNEEQLTEYSMEQKQNVLKVMINGAFGYNNCEYVDKVYPKKQPKNKEQLEIMINELLYKPLRKLQKNEIKNNIMKFLEYNEDSNSDSEYEIQEKYKKKSNISNTSNIIDLLDDVKITREDKLNEITIAFDSIFPKLKGDKVTFIGSTFIKHGENEPYLNHCIALDTCDNVNNSIIECYKEEKDVLLAWTRLIQRENPDIIIGYNIFGFDYKFMFNRAKELGFSVVKEFLKLSRNKNEICGQIDEKTGMYKIEETSITIASGTHNLEFIKMNGRVQIDLYNYFRRSYNLSSYKLDFVSGNFICDKIKKIEYEDDMSIIHSKNLVGLKKGNYIHLEEIGHTSEYYNNGMKYCVINVDELNGNFTILNKVEPDMKKTVKWCLSKDDVSPQDIFRMTNEGPSERAIIAKYCIQDCNIVHHLFKKIDVMTEFIEMAKICSVPIDYLVMRGQGIKLFSFVAKKCREAKTLIPVLDRKDDGGYEGAIVLEPKCGLYLNEPIACVDYSSLYPSSMISENLSHDSKVWTREYDLEGNLIKETGEKDSSGNFIYDNLPEYKYVDINYDTYEYFRKSPKSAAIKTKVGSKMCRFAQFPNGELAIMPRILKELLAARKATRNSANWKTITTNIGDFTGLIIDKTNDHITLKDKDNKIKIIETSSIKNIEDTYNDFMQNVLDKRQLAIKVTANSLYGQCGAKTSSFYEKDVAASTTATGRKLLTYGKRIIEEVYGDRICETSYGKVHSHAEYIYGDSVLGDTPILVKGQYNNVFIKNIQDLSYDGNWENYDEFKPYDTYKSNRREKEQYKIDNLKVWSKSGWSQIIRIIRHKCNKSIYRIHTSDNGIIDVTEDHSLLDKNGVIIQPKNVLIGQELLINNELLSNLKKSNTSNIVNEYKRLFENNNSYYYEKQNKYRKSINYLYNLLFCNTNTNINTIITNIEILYEKYNDYVYDIEVKDGTFNCGFSTIIKNTDSVFMSFKLTNPETGEKIVGKESLKHTIELAKEAGSLATKFLKEPHDLEYEKTFMPFCLLSKKRYVGMLYENDPDICYRKSMGIVLKRRDNAPIVKDIYGGIIDILMKDQDVNKAIEFTKDSLNNIVEEKYPLEKLIITKSLRAFYKNPLQIAHKVLADKMGKRDPGNKPGPGDRIPFVYIQTKNNVKLQGEKIEHPNYIIDNKLKPDYIHYITNQIMKPVQQVFALVLEDIPSYKKYKNTLERKIKCLKRKYNDDPDKQNIYEQKYRNDEVKKLIFDDSLRKCYNFKNNQKSILSFLN
jgi:DNA polymerase elongation subunit (family B)